MRFEPGIIVTIIFVLIINSCKEKGSKFIDQGEIFYTIEYLGNFGSVPEAFMPKNLIVSFKEDKILFEILSPIGKSGIRILSNPDDSIYDTYVNMPDYRYYYAAHANEPFPGFEDMNGIEIKKTSKTSSICGYSCKNAEVTFPADRNKIYNIWYTNEINVKTPNLSTPFSEIDGVLMSFFFIIGQKEMHFNAESVYKKDVLTETFERKQKYLLISREDYSRFLNKMISF
jgi:hypothetical protein